VLCALFIRCVTRTGISVVSAGPQYSTTEVHAAKPAPEEQMVAQILKEQRMIGAMHLDYAPFYLA
jgi:hypothetical protein